MKQLIIIFAVILFSCSTEEIDRDEFYHRENNAGSKLLNEYLAEFLVQSEPFRLDRKIYLNDELSPVDSNFSIKLKKLSKNTPDTNFKEALFDLSNSNKAICKINFTQIKNIRGIKLIAGPFYDKKNIHKYGKSEWEYTLSLPGYNKDSTSLCFTSDYYCGPLCACFSIVYMIKINGKWQFLKEDILLIS